MQLPLARVVASDALEDETSPLTRVALSDEAPPLPPELVRKLCWRLIPMLWLGYILNIVDRTNLGFAQLQMGADLGLSPRAFGNASGAVPPFPVLRLIGKSAFVTRPKLLDYTVDR